MNNLDNKSERIGHPALTEVAARIAESNLVPVGPELLGLSIEAIERAYAGRTPPEVVRMYLAIVSGMPIGSTSGWFGPAQSRYSWEWLAERHHANRDSGVTADSFLGSAIGFQRLDRDHDGRITADDLDWSDHSPWMQQASGITRLFRSIESNGDGRLTREEWLAFFESVALGNDEITLGELCEAWLSRQNSGYLPGDAPTEKVLLGGLFNGELGSVEEGPQLNELAPDFCLQTYDGAQTIRLADRIGSKPVVLVFGNFTCGPFRAMYPGIDQVYRRFQGEAEFLAIYVREAHPTDGWRMCANDNIGITVAQPKTYADRAKVANQCHRLLKPAIPLLVDDLNDLTGNAYSGMPARLYVLDRAGRVSYKSGRGPFGFKIGEMEQALVMTLLDNVYPA